MRKKSEFRNEFFFCIFLIKDFKFLLLTLFDKIKNRKISSPPKTTSTKINFIKLDEFSFDGLNFH